MDVSDSAQTEYRLAWDRYARWPSARALAIGLALLVVGPAVSPLSAASPNPSASVDSCTTIDKPGVYTLSQDLESSGNACIRIESSDVTLDGSGHTIKGTGDGFGIRTADTGLSNITVTSIEVTGWLAGVQFRHVNEGMVKDVTAAGNTNGIALWRSSDIRVGNVTAIDNDHQGLRLIHTDESTVTESAAVKNTADGFLLKNSPDNELSDNVASRNGMDAGADGFLITGGSHRTDVIRNEANENTDDGFDIKNSSENRIVANNASYNVGVVNSDGIEIRYSHRNVIRENTANNNVDDGIDLQVANNNTVANNVANENVNDGIPIAHSHNNSVRENVANYNSKVDREITGEMLPGKELEEKGSEGLTLRSNSSHNTLTRNTVKDNQRQGIRIWHHAPQNAIINNSATGNADDGIAVLNSTGNAVKQNEVRNNGANGIHLNNGAPDTELRHNSVHDNRLSGILVHTADGTRVMGNAVTGNAAGSDANGIRVSTTDSAVLVMNSVSDNGGTAVLVLKSEGIRLLKSGAVEVTDSDDITVVRSWRLRG